MPKDCSNGVALLEKAKYNTKRSHPCVQSRAPHVQGDALKASHSSSESPRQRILEPKEEEQGEPGHLHLPAPHHAQTLQLSGCGRLFVQSLFSEENLPDILSMPSHPPRGQHGRSHPHPCAQYILSKHKKRFTTEKSCWELA